MTVDLQHGGLGDDGEREEALQRQLFLARAQGDAYEAARAERVRVGGGGEERLAGDYWVGFAIQGASGKYERSGGGFRWSEPSSGEVEVLVTVRDAGDGRFIPGVRVAVTLVDAEGVELGTGEHPLVWHPMIYGYARDWRVPGNGLYSLRVRVEPPLFARHDERNGLRFSDAAEVEFTGVRIEPTQ